MLEERWEHGSFFALPGAGLPGVSKYPLGQTVDQRNYGSGRMALQALIDHGAAHLGWRRLWAPSYYCEDVIQALDYGGIEFARYPLIPGSAGVLPQAADGDVLLRTSYFGWPMMPDGHWGGEVIDDCSHAPGLFASSKADFAFASLRKCLPLPDGAVVWSPLGYDLPPAHELDHAHENLALMRLSAMAQKRAYLNGADFEKEAYRKLEVATEDGFRAQPISAMSPWSTSLLAAFDSDDWERQRLVNYRAFCQAMDGIAGIKLLSAPSGSMPMIAVLQLPDRSRRDWLRERLVKESIYTAVLWPPPEGQPEWYGEQEREFAETTLCVHVDGRYSKGDLEQVAAGIRAIMKRQMIEYA